MNEQDRQMVLRYFGGKDPNPERKGCPDKAILRQIAQGKLPAASPWYSHMTNCGACVLQTEQMRAEIVHRQVVFKIGSAAALLLMVLGGTIWLTRSPRTEARPAAHPPDQIAGSADRDVAPARISPGGPTPQPPIKRDAPLARLDLRAFAPVRGSDQAQVVVPTISAVEQRLEVLLPIASEPGRYRVRLLNRALEPARETQGTAVIRGGRTVLSVTLNAAAVPAGDYQLALQHGTDEWRLYPLIIREK